MDGKTRKLSILKTDKPYQSSKSDQSTPLINEYTDSGSEGSSEGNLPHHTFRSDSRLSFDKVYTDSENEDQIDENRTVDSVIDSSLQLLNSLPSKNPVSNHKKPSNQKSDKTWRKASQFSNGAKSKQKQPEEKSNLRQGAAKSKKQKTDKSKDKSDFAGSHRAHRSKVDEFTSDSQLLREIYEDVQRIKIDVEEIKKDQRHAQETRREAETERGIRENFISKYNLDLPYADKEAFEEFNLRLLNDTDFREEFMKSLLKLFDREAVPSKTLTNILRKYLTTELAMRYTAIKKMPTKFLLKDTAFYDCLLGVLADTHRDKSGRFVTESVFASLLGNVLGNAKDWKGNRRRKIQKNLDPEQEDSDH